MKATFWKVTVAEHLIGRRAIYRDISAGEYSARYESCTLPEKPDKLYPYTWCFPSVCVEKLYNAMVLVEFPELSKSNSLTKAASTCAGAGTGSGAGLAAALLASDINVTPCSSGSVCKCSTHLQEKILAGTAIVVIRSSRWKVYYPSDLGATGSPV